MNSHEPGKTDKPVFKPKTAPPGAYLLAAALGLPLFGFLPKWSGVVVLAMLAVVLLALWVWAKSRLRRPAE